MTRSIKESGVQTKYENSKLYKVNYRRGAPAVRKTLPMKDADANKWGFPNYPSGMMTKAPGPPMGTKKGGYEESKPGTPRTLRKLPASIKDGGID